LGTVRTSWTFPQRTRSTLSPFSHWAQKLDKSSAEVICLVAREPMKAMMPFLLTELAKYRAGVLDAAYYWSYKTMPFLELVYKTPFPAVYDHEVIRDWGYEYDRLAKTPAEDILFIVKHARTKHK
jgi:hypothetical protein